MKKGTADRNQVFLFVNKDQTSRSLSKSEGGTAKEINRHAQQVRNRRLQAQKANSARTSSSSARRIALGGWKKRDGNCLQDLGTGSPVSPAPTSIHSPVTPSNEQETSPLTPFSSSERSAVSLTGSSSASASPTDQSPERTEPEQTVRQTEPLTPIDQDANIENMRGIEGAKSSSVAFANFSPIDGVDPFGQMPVKVNAAYHAILQHALRIYPFAGNNYKLAFLPQHMRASMNQFPITKVVQQSVFQPHHLYSLLATMSIRSKHIYGSNLGGSETPESFRDKSALHIRKELMKNSRTGKVDKHTILDICFLSVSEMSYQQYDAARTHLRVVGKLMPLLDTRQNFDFWVSETAAHVDNQLALMSGARPILPFDFDPGPMLPERMVALKRELHSMLDKEMAPKVVLPSLLALRVANAPNGLRDAIADLASTLDLRMGSQFEYGLKIGIFDQRMSRIVKDLTECIAIAKVVWLSPLAVCFDAEWLCRKARAVLRALLSIAPESNIGPLDMMGKCMESARLSLIIMMSHACTLIGFQTAKGNVQRLQRAMNWALQHWCPFIGLTLELKPINDREFSKFTYDQMRFILWSAMVGIWAAVDCPETEEWFLVRVCNLCRTLGVRTFEDLTNHMVLFLYSTTLQEQSLRRVAKVLEGG